MLKSLLTVLLILCFQVNLFAQEITVDEIIENYFENTGGKENWKKLRGLKMTATFNQGGLQVPLEIVQLSDGRQYTKFNVQGSDYFQNVFDGETLWSIDFATLKPTKADEESVYNFKLDLNDFPDSFMDYRDKGYVAELMGSEVVDGTDTYKVKLTKEPRKINGEKVEDVNYYFFDKITYIPIAQEAVLRTGPQAGSISRSTQSDFDEVDGLYFPFSLAQGIKDGPMQPIEIQKIEVNPDIDASLLAFPGDN